MPKLTQQVGGTFFLPSPATFPLEAFMELSLESKHLGLVHLTAT